MPRFLCIIVVQSMHYSIFLTGHINIDRLCRAHREPKVVAAPQPESAMTQLRYPSPEEIRAIECAARRARNQELIRLARVAAAAARSLCVRAISAVSAGMRRAPNESRAHARRALASRS